MGHVLIPLMSEIDQTQLILTDFSLSSKPKNKEEGTNRINPFAKELQCLFFLMAHVLTGEKI